MISVKDVHKSYTAGKEIIKGVSFEVKDGMIFGLLGPNGAGKTTLMQMISTLLAPTSGSITIDGLNAKDNLLEIHRRIGYLTTEVRLDPMSTPDRLWDFFASLYDIPKKDAVKRKEDIRSRVRSLILSKLNTLEVTGRDLITERVIVQYVLKTLQRDRELLDRLGMDSFRIIGLEKKFTMELDGFKFIGFIDRMDSFLPGELRIVDYKTGKVEDKEVEITDAKAAALAEALFGNDNSKRPKVAFQLFLYDILAGGSEEAEGMTLVNSIYQPSRFFTEGVRNVPVSAEFNGNG